MENPEYAAALLQRVREIGAALMLDRFGAGYTSLGHLPQYRFDAMRIDASLVRPNAFGARSPILRSIVAMAQEIGMDVISEGAETKSDAVELAQIGCQFAQGDGVRPADERGRRAQADGRRAGVILTASGAPFRILPRSTITAETRQETASTQAARLRAP